MTSVENTITDPSSLDYGKTEQELAAQNAAVANGVQVTTKARKDYWSNEEILTYFLPGQEGLSEADKQFITYKKMNEGMRARFQKATNKGVVIERASSNARMGMDPAGDRHALLEISIQGWRLFRGDEEVAFKPHVLRQFIEQADPDLIDDIEKAIRKANPWMIAELGSEEIQKQIDDLEEQKKVAKDREDEEKNS